MHKTNGVIYLKRRGLICILIAVLLLSYASIAFAGQIDEKQKELKDIRGNIEGTKGEIESVKGEQEDVSTQLAKLEGELRENKIQLEKTENELIETQENLEVTKEELKAAIEEANVHKGLMKERLCAMYMCTNTSYLEIIFEAKNFTDFLDRIVMVREIVSLDQQVLEEMQAIEEEIQEKKLQLEEQETSIEQKKAKIISTRETIESQQAEREALLVKLKEQEEELEEGLAKLEKESKEIEETIKRYIEEQAEKERKRKEEERRRREEDRRRKEQEQLAAKGNTSSRGNSSSGTTSPKNDSNNKPTGGDSTPKYTGGSMTWPVPGYYSITSPYGYRTHPVSGKRKLHRGIDIAGGGINGQSAVAAASGTVMTAQYYGGYGNCVIIDHGGGLSTLYGHGSSILVSPGQSVKKGQPVLKVGSTGVSTGPHLHFEVRKNGSPVNPMNYVK